MQHRQRMIVAGLVALAWLPGCVYRTPVRPGRGAGSIVVEPVRWPERPDPQPLSIVSGGEYGELIDRGHRGEGVFYELRLKPVQIRVDGRFTIGVGAQGRAWFKLSGSRKNVDEPDPPAWASWSKSTFLFSSEGARSLEFLGHDGVRRSVDAHVDTPDITLISFAVPETAEVRGTVVALGSINGMNTGERALLEELRARGWIIVKTTPSLSQLIEGFSLPPDGDVDALIDDFARRINHNVSERAYALEAALGFLGEHMLHVTDRPVVAIGCSAGAIALPTVVARMPVPVEAAVLVGGGCDLYRIVTTSDLFRDHLDVEVDRRPITGPELRALHGPILERAHLDPYHTASCLHDVPVLMLHGSYDRIVPADCGELLYERLGRPERWTYPLGHIGLFFVLPLHVDAVADWIETQVDSAEEHPRDVPARSPRHRGL